MTAAGTEQSTQRGDRQIVAYFVLSPLPTIHEMQALPLSALAALPTGSLNGSLRTGDDLVQRALLERQTRVVLIDEVQHLLNIPRRQRPTLFDWFNGFEYGLQDLSGLCRYPGFGRGHTKRAATAYPIHDRALAAVVPGPAFGSS